MKHTTDEINSRFDLLAEYERRCVVQFLRETADGHADLADIVSHLTKQDPTPRDPASIETGLRHNHLPRLAATDVLEFDPRSETVRYYGDELLEDLLEDTPETHVSRA